MALPHTTDHQHSPSTAALQVKPLHSIKYLQGVGMAPDSTGWGWHTTTIESNVYHFSHMTVTCPSPAHKVACSVDPVCAVHGHHFSWLSPAEPPLQCGQEPQGMGQGGVQSPRAHEAVTMATHGSVTMATRTAYIHCLEVWSGRDT